MSWSTEAAAAFDDDALVALGSTGLVRRAARLEATVGATDADPVVVAVGTDEVTFSRGHGLASGACTCATVGVCQHVIAAIVALRPAPDQLPPSAEVGLAPDEQPELEPLAWIEGLEVEALRAFGGLAALRWAVNRLELADDDAIVSTHPPTVRLPGGASVRFMGETLEAAFCDPSTNNDPRSVVLAALLVQRQAGKPAPEVEAPTRSRTDHQAWAGLGAQVHDALLDLVDVGFVRASGSTVERFEALAIDARGDRLYRAAQLTTRLASSIEAQIDRRVDADAGTLLDDAALLYAIADRVRRLADERVEPPTWLAGRSRAEYVDRGSCDLLYLAAYAWRAASGLAGMSGVLFDPETNEFLEVGTADIGAGAPPSLSRFVGWGGGATFAKMEGRVVSLTGAMASAQLRLSTSRQTRALIGDRWLVDALEPATWDGQPPARPTRLRGLAPPAWTIVDIQDSTPPHFDPVTQTLRWGITASSGPLTATVPWSDASATLVEAVEAVAAQRPTHLLGRLGSAHGETTLFPIGAIASGRMRQLAFGDVQTKRRRRRRTDQDATSAERADDSVERIGVRLAHAAERGAAALDDRWFETQSGRAGALGFPAVERVLADPAVEPGARLYRALHIVAEHRERVRA